MTKIFPVEPAQNIYANDLAFKLISKRDLLFEGRTIEKLIYRDAHSLIWKIWQVALAVFSTIVTLGAVLCLHKGIIWKETLALIKDRIVYQNIPPQPVLPVIIPFVSKPGDVGGTTPIPSLKLTPVLPVTVPSPTPKVAPPPPPSRPSPVHLKKAEILKENPEYENAVRAWEKAGVLLHEQVVRLEKLRQYAFGTDKWTKHFGEIVGTIPPLPDDIYQIYNSDDHSISGSKVKDTHVLVLVPRTIYVDGKLTDMTLTNLRYLVQDPKSGNKTHCQCLMVDGHEYTPVVKAHWALMKKDVFPHSKSKTFAEQVKIVKEYSGQMKADYKVPNAIDALACCFMHYVDTGQKLFSLGPEGWTYTRCEEQVRGQYGTNRIVVGHYAPEGLTVFDAGSITDEFCVTAIRTF